MSDLELSSLPNKYRPKTLSDFIGQEHVTTTFKGWFARGKIPQAVLFAGNSGCGKTTIGRMLARYINCQNFDKENLRPCGECRNCKLENNPDLVEMNIGSARGIDDIRGLIDQCKSMPMMGGKRVILLDEVHALTKQAGDAILTTLESPPKHVIFILCTTNPEKLLATIRGRCTLFAIKPIEPEVMAKRLRIIAKREGYVWKDIDPEGAIMKMLCDLSHGQMRDGIQLLDIVLSALASGDEISTEDLLSRFVGTSESDMEEQAANLVIAAMTNNLPDLVRAVKACTGNARGLLSKTRWLLEFLIDKRVGTVKWTPYSGRVLAARMKKDSAIKINFSKVIALQSALCRIEANFNSLSIPEEIQLYTGLADLLGE